MPENNSIKLEPSWKRELEPEFAKPYMENLRSFLKAEYTAGKKIYPHANEYFSAFNLTPFDGVKVVVIGQDPYHGPNQAHGLCFSVRPGVRTPPSLQNIYKEIATDLGFKAPNHGCLVSWAQQGVLLLNATLTVEHGKAGSHQGHGWEEFTDRVIAVLNEKREHLVFVLWGSFAQKKGAFIDRHKHLVLESPHPSPFSAHRGFLGNRHFSLINRYLTEHGNEPIQWQLPTNPQMPT